MNYLLEKLGTGRPAVAIVGCLHGDEIIGQKVINALKNSKLKKGSLALIIAHPEAGKEKKRFLFKDLNRSFPGIKGGRAECGLAYELHKILKNKDLVLDIHATNANFKNLAIITKLNKRTMEILKFIPLKKIVLIDKNIFGGKEMIAHCKLGISLDYGPNKTGKNYAEALSHIKIILRNLGLISGKLTLFKQKVLYKVMAPYMVSANFKPNKNLKEFCFIRQGQKIGKVGKKIIKAKQGFYPLFLDKGSYKRTFALIAKKEKILLDRTFKNAGRGDRN